MTTPMVRLADCKPEHSAFVFEIRRAAFREYVEGAGGWNEDGQKAAHDERFSTQQFRLIEVDHAVVGYVATMMRPAVCELHQLMVLPEHQGRGYGTQVLNTVCTEADSVRVPIRLRVRMNNPRARALYERLGFVHVTDTPTHWVLQRAVPHDHPRSATTPAAP